LLRQVPHTAIGSLNYVINLRLAIECV
jgi:hypothetical protein